VADSTAVALNGRFSGTLQPTGTQTAAYNLFDAIMRHQRRKLPVVVFADTAFPGVAGWEKIDGVELVDVPFSHWSRARSQLWEQLVFPARCATLRVRVAHHPMTTSPALSRSLRTIVTLHDLHFWLHPEWYSRRFRAVYRLTAIPGLRSADKVVAVSDYVREQAIQALSISPERVRRIYNGVRAIPSEMKLPASSQSAYVLCVGSLQPHKNLRRIVRAWEIVTETYPDLQLWVIGRKQPRFRSNDDFAQLLNRTNIKVMGYVSDGELFEAYANAAAFLYPSLEEGFGLPVLEAMQAATPVVTSNTSCLPEICAGAAELVDPLSEASIATGLRNVLALSAEERQSRITGGKLRARRFSWSKAAEEYLELYSALAR
jgi:glycosyltransferase involved in cell wall biosynthesis